jgi:hypothetical protein
MPLPARDAPGGVLLTVAYSRRGQILPVAKSQAPTPGCGP